MLDHRETVRSLRKTGSESERLGICDRLYDDRINAWRQSLSIEPLPLIEHYRVCAIDGSQVYADRHRGFMGALIQVALAELQYGAQSSASFVRKVHALVSHDGFPLPDVAVDKARADYELKYAFERITRESSVNVLLFDGTLPPLDGGVSSCAREHGVALGAYISRPQACDALCGIPDAHVLEGYLAPGFRTGWILGSCGMAACYLHSGSEIARVEVPDWIAKSSIESDRFLGIIANQCSKGRGYPRVLALAHFYAVISAADREVFLRLWTKGACGMSEKQRLKARGF